MADNRVTKKKKKKKPVAKRRRRIFRPAYLSFVFVLLGAIILTLVIINDKLVDFEASQPKYAIEPYQKLFIERDYDALMRLSGDNDASVITLSHAPGEVTVLQSYSANHDEVRYQARADRTKVGEILLIKNEEGPEAWTLSQLTLDKVTFVEEEEEEEEPPVVERLIQVLAPSDASVEVDGVTMTDENVLETGIPDEAKERLPSGIAVLPEYTRYEATTALTDPQIVVTSADGDGLTVALDGDDAFRTRPKYSAELKEAYTENVLTVGKAFALFTSGKISKDKIRSYMAGSKSPGYKAFNKYDNSWYIEHSSHRFTDERAGNFIEYSPEAFSCEVSYIYSLKTGSKKSIDMPTRVTCYYVKAKKGWRVYDFILGSELLTDEEAGA